MCMLLCLKSYGCMYYHLSIISPFFAATANCISTNNGETATTDCSSGSVCCTAVDDSGTPQVRCCPAQNECGPYYSGLGTILCLTSQGKLVIHNCPGMV